VTSSQKFVLFLAVAVAAAFSLPAHAVLIDDFSDAAAVSATSGTPSDNAATASGSFLGTDRQLDSDWTSGPNSVDGDIDSGGSGLLTMSTGANTSGTLMVLWQNIGGVDLSAAGTLNAISLGIDFDDLPVDIVLDITDSSANTGSASTTAPGGIFLPISQDILFASFSGSVDFSAVETIKLTLTPQFPAADIQINFIESTFVVPEPTTLAGLSLMGLLLVARRRRNVA